MKRTIVGIDPGTTAALAVLDLHSAVLKVVSFRVHDPALLISEIIAVGKPIVIACDKKAPPEAVAWISRKLGCKLFSPPQDLLSEEKRLLVKEKTGNVHEFDALAAARSAEGHYRRLFQKIDRVLEAKGKEYLSEEMKEFLIRNDEINIDEAIRTLEPREKVIVRKKERSKDDLRRDDLACLREVLSLQEERLRLMKMENSELLAKLASRPVPARKARDALLSEKEERIVLLSKKIASLERSLGEKAAEMSGWRSFTADIGAEWIVVQRVPDLSLESLKGKSDAEVLFVDAPEIMNERVGEKVKSLRTVITRKMPKDRKRFTFVNADSLSLKEKDGIVLVRKDELEQEIKGKDMLSKVVREYQESRTK